MKLLISGICGFAGSTIATTLRANDPTLEISGFDNFVRSGSESNRRKLQSLGVKVQHADLRLASDVEALPSADWVLDAAALPSVLAGVDGKSSSRQLLEHNLLGTINLLEYCKARRAGFILLSTSRVYSIPPLATLPLVVVGDAFRPDPGRPLPEGISPQGIGESFSSNPPLSLYGATKLASEVLALEYAATYGFPVHINRCGVLAGAGQFGQAEQGIFSFWVHSWRRRRPLRYIGYEGRGFQVRDCLHPRDLAPLLIKQLARDSGGIMNVAGGTANSMSLAQLSTWCRDRFGPHQVTSDPRPRPFDVPWMVLDAAHCRQAWDWLPITSWTDILEEIARHAEAEPAWLDLCDS